MNTESTHEDPSQWAPEILCRDLEWAKIAWNKCPKEFCQKCVMRVKLIMKDGEFQYY